MTNRNIVPTQDRILNIRNHARQTLRQFAIVPAIFLGLVFALSIVASIFLNSPTPIFASLAASVLFAGITLVAFAITSRLEESTIKLRARQK